MEQNKVSLGGLYVIPFTSVNEMLNYIESKKKILVAVNSNKLRMTKTEIKRIVNDNIGYADSRGAMLVLHQKGFANAIQIPGCELWLKVINAFYKNKTFYLIGGSQYVIDKTIEQLTSEFPEIKILGARNGYIKDEESDIVISDIQEKKPDVVFVAMGSPKQEFFMDRAFSKHQALYLGLGGSFDVYTNTVPRVPKWWRDHNMEGLYKTIKTKRFNRIAWTIEFYIKYKLRMY